MTQINEMDMQFVGKKETAGYYFCITCNNKINYSPIGKRQLRDYANYSDDIKPTRLVFNFLLCAFNKQTQNHYNDRNLKLCYYKEQELVEKQLLLLQFKMKCKIL